MLHDLLVINQINPRTDNKLFCLEPNDCIKPSLIQDDEL